MSTLPQQEGFQMFAGLSGEVRSSRAEAYIDGFLVIMVATLARDQLRTGAEHPGIPA